MNILVLGMLWSGSSAVIDMLEEYKSVAVIPGEFDEFRRPGMVADHLSGRISEIYKSNIDKHINEKTNFKTLIKRALKLDFNYYKRLNAIKDFSKAIALTSSTEEKITLARCWLEDLKNIYSKNKKFTAIDQPILLGQHFDIWPKVLEPFKMIIVYRDPRDQLAEIIRQNHLFLHMRSPDADIYGGDRFGAIKYQIATLKSRYQWIDKIKKEHGPDNVITISFEKFIKEHNVLRRSLEGWLCLEKSSKTKNILDTSISINNIGIYKAILKDSEVKLLNDLYSEYLNREEKNMFYINLIRNCFLGASR